MVNRNAVQLEHEHPVLQQKHRRLVLAWRGTERHLTDGDAGELGRDEIDPVLDLTPLELQRVQHADEFR